MFLAKNLILQYFHISRNISLYNIQVNSIKIMLIKVKKDETKRIARSLLLIFSVSFKSVINILNFATVFAYTEKSKQATIYWKTWLKSKWWKSDIAGSFCLLFCSELFEDVSLYQCHDSFIIDMCETWHYLLWKFYWILNQASGTLRSIKFVNLH